jgi:prepilin-type N-terminal cleavage/methylation domain-containing protein
MSSRAPIARSRTAGFTLIEVMGALLILSVGMASALRLATASTTRLRYVDHKAVAVRIASERIDSLGAVSYAGLPPRVWADTVQRGAQRWVVRYTITQWSTRVRKLEVTTLLVGDTLSSGPVTTYLPDSW